MNYDDISEAKCPASDLLIFPHERTETQECTCALPMCFSKQQKPAGKA